MNWLYPGGPMFMSYGQARRQDRSDNINEETNQLQKLCNWFRILCQVVPKGTSQASLSKACAANAQDPCFVRTT